ncbi:MAG: ATP-dependent DNA helicase UvrD2 [Actinomycetes bacterium]
MPLDPEVVLAGLDDEQRAAAMAVTGPVVILAGAGTGKTRALTHRIAYATAIGAQDPTRGLAVTFTTRAAGEMRTRLTGLEVPALQVRTFHAAALRQLKFFWPRVVGGDFPKLLESKARVVAEAASRCGLPTDTAIVRDLAAEIEWAKSSGHAVDDYVRKAAGRTMPADLLPADVARVYSSYDDIRIDRDLLDFEDALLLTVAMLDQRQDVADEIRKQYRWFTVDEFQDVNPMQARLLELWLGDSQEVCVVGDAGQTIYTFTGASPEHLLSFTKRYPDAVSVRLVRSYRCSPQIVALANRVLDAATGPAAALRVSLRSEAEAGPAPTITAYDDEPAEAAAVAAQAAKLIAAGLLSREIAVLYRTNAQSEVYEAAFANAGVPTVLRGGERFFDRAEVRTGITLLRGAARAAGSQSDATAQPVELGQEVAAVLSNTGWMPKPPAGSGAVRERWESLAALVSLAEDLAASQPLAGLSELVAELDRRAEVQHAPQVAGVTLASLHAAKGLEWTAVFVVGLAEGMLPIVYADTPERIEEERRLLYVGVTRAKRDLALSWSKARSPGGRTGRNPSRFLADLTGAAVPQQPKSATTKRRKVAHCRACGRSLVTAAEATLGRCTGCPANLDADLYDRLREWRLRLAGHRGVPAYVVFTDRTLQAIAELQPSDSAGLAEIAGIGPRKLVEYGEQVLELIAGAAVANIALPEAPPIA